MRILFAAAIEAGSAWANTINSVKMAEGFARLGHAVTLLCRQPATGPVAEAELIRHYGLSAPLAWIQLPPRGWFGRTLNPHTDFLVQTLPTILRQRFDLIYARNYMVPWAAARLGRLTVAETHAEPDNPTTAFARLVAASRLPATQAWVTISNTLATGYVARGVPADKIVVLPDAVDLDLFRRPQLLPPAPFARTGKPVALYAGHLYDYKGIPTVLEAARYLPEIAFHLVGGWPEDVQRHAAWIATHGLTNVVLHGAVAHADLPPYLWAADVLLLPPSAEHVSAAWTSPVKLGEYLAARQPVVASAIPALRDWLTDTDVRFFMPDDPRALAKAISATLADSQDSAERVERGWQLAQQWTYTRRAQRVLDFVNIG